MFFVTLLVKMYSSCIIESLIAFKANSCNTNNLFLVNSIILSSFIFFPFWKYFYVSNAGNTTVIFKSIYSNWPTKVNEKKKENQTKPKISCNANIILSE